MRNPFTNFRTVHRLNMERLLIPILQRSFNWGKILEIGSKDARYLKHVKYLEYLTLDNDPNWKPDIFQSIEQPCGENQYDSIFCFQVLEHVPQPFSAVRNIHTALKKGGKFLASVPFQFPNHSKYDYWRYTKQGCEVLCEQFDEVQIIPYGNFITSSWTLFNWHNYFGMFNWLIHKVFYFVDNRVPDGFVIIAKK